jgi:hypothetical protein
LATEKPPGDQFGPLKKNQQRTEYYLRPAIGKTILWLRVLVDSTARRFLRRAARLSIPRKRIHELLLGTSVRRMSLTLLE